MVRVASGMQDLQQDLAARVMHRAGDASVPAGLGRGDQFRRERQQPTGAVWRVAAGDDQSDTAAGAFGEVLGEPIDVAGPVFQSGVHRTHHHPIAQRGEPKVQRRQQVRVTAFPSARATRRASRWRFSRGSARSTRYWCSAAPRMPGVGRSASRARDRRPAIGRAGRAVRRLGAQRGGVPYTRRAI